MCMILCVFVCMCVCVFVRKYLCVYEFMYVFMLYVCMSVILMSGFVYDFYFSKPRSLIVYFRFFYVYMCVWLYVCMFGCVYVLVCPCLCVSVCMCRYIYVTCVYLCMFFCVYLRMCVYCIFGMFKLLDAFVCMLAILLFVS